MPLIRFAKEFQDEAVPPSFLQRLKQPDDALISIADQSATNSMVQSVSRTGYNLNAFGFQTMRLQIDVLDKECEVDGRLLSGMMFAFMNLKQNPVPFEKSNSSSNTREARNLPEAKVVAVPLNSFVEVPSYDC
jgi:hypothetical protein